MTDKDRHINDAARAYQIAYNASDKPQADKAYADLLKLTEPLIKLVADGFNIPAMDKEDVWQHGRMILAATAQSWDAKDGKDGKGTFAALLHTALRRRILDLFRAATGRIDHQTEENTRRRAAIHKAINLTTPDGDALYMPDPALNPLDKLASEDATESIMALICPEDRPIFRLVMQGYKYKEMAAILGMSEFKVTHWLYFARKRCQENKDKFLELFPI